MAKKYEKHPTDDGKYQSVIDSYGHGIGNGKSRQAVSKNHDKVLKARIEDAKAGETLHAVMETEPMLESQPESEPETEVKVKESSEPDWLNIDFGDDEGGEETHSIPLPIQGLIGAMSGQADPDAVRTPAQLRAWYQQQARLVRYFLAGIVDPAVSWWMKGITADPEMGIKRSQSEWDMTEAVTEQFLAHNQISVMVNPNMLMAGMMGALYVPPVVKAVRKRDPNRKSAIGGFIQRWRSRRAMKKALKANPHLNAEDIEWD
tara:strand:+ start:1295 stop:2077 length:783 start_codon:yes stop_codon:yes gene_type:complete